MKFEISCERTACSRLWPEFPRLQAILLQALVCGAGAFLALTDRPGPLLCKADRWGRRMNGLSLRCITAGGIRWPYLEGGEGFPILLLHGFGADKDRFGPLPALLMRGFRVIIPDIPGFGDHSRLWTLSYDVLSQMQRLADFVRALNLASFHLLGISLGGFIAGCYAARFPEQVRSLVLMSSAGIDTPEVSDAFQLFTRRGCNLFLYEKPGEVQRLIDYLMFRPILLPQRIRQYWADQGAARLAWRRKLFDDLVSGGLHGLDEAAARIKARTLLVWGAQDRICHVSAVPRLLSLIPDSRAVVIGECGHLLLLEQPRLCLKVIRRFLDG